MTELVGRIALVTGGSRGIGHAISMALARAGADVAVNFRANETEAQLICSEITRLSRKALSVRADVSIASEVTRLIETVECELGPISILINNAGIARSQPLDAITETDWDEIIRVNLKSAFLVTQAVLPGMQARRWGRIINLSSMAAQVGGVVGPHYAASKAGLLGLTHSYALLLAKDGITVNAIAPALIKTDMIANISQSRADAIPLGHLGDTNDVADVAVMLARNDYMTGQTISVNGGWYMT